MGDALPVTTLFGAVGVAVWIGGYRPALLVAALGYLACAYLFIQPRGQIGLGEPRNLISLFLFLTPAAIIIGFGEALRRAGQYHRMREEVASEQAGLLRTTLASIGDGVIAADADGRITSMNAVAEKLTGWTHAEAAGVPLTQVFRIVNESTRQEVENPALRALKEGVIVGLANHTLLIAKDGTERPIDDSAAPIRHPGGEIIGCVLVFRDITERHQAEAEKREALQQIATTLESVTDGFMRYDKDWRIVYVNAEAERINRLTRDEMLGRNLWEVFPALVGTHFEAEFRRAVAEQTTVEFENHYEPFGRWYSLKGYPTADGGLTTFIRDITAQKEVEQRLVESEARYRAIGESIDYGVWVCDPMGRNTYASESFLQMVGITQEQCSNFGWGDVLHPDDADATIAAWKECVQTQGKWDRVHRFKGVDGRWHSVLARGVPLRDAAGQILGWAGINLDISRMMQAEQEIVRLAAESERQRRLYETVLTNTPDFVYVFSLDHKVVYANEALIKMWGRGREGAIGKTFLEIGYEPWHAEMHDREIDQVRTTRQPIRGEVPFTGTHGRRHYDYIFVPIIGADGEVEAVAGTTRDVTERHVAEAALRESEERSAFVRRSTGVGFWYCDLPFDVLQWDELVKAHFHLPPDATVTIDTFYDRLHPDDREPTRLAIERSITSRETYNVVYRTVNPDTGAVTWVRAIGRTFYADDGTPTRFDGVTLDVSDQKRAEEERERLLHQLRDQDRRKDEFLAVLAHELRNPLAPIHNGLQVMRLAGADGTIEQTRAMMERQLTQLVRLVDDLLDVSRVTSGKLTLQKERIELRTIIDAAIETARPVIEQAGHQWSVVAPDEPIHVDGDATRLAQVVSNLLNNSAKYTHRGGHIRLTVRREDNIAVVGVADDGIGIPPNMLGTVFEMFTQVERELEKTTGGLGIGLSLVKGLVEMHGGTIEARSDGEGRGSEFIVRLPVVSLAVSEVEPPVIRESAGLSSRRRILVADDNVDSAESLRRLLELLGNDVSTANDGLQAVGVAETFRPHLVLLDIGMPKLNGHETCRRIREQPWGRNAILVAMTGWGQEEDRRLSHEAGFDLHLVKPVNFEAIKRLLSSLRTEMA